MPAMTALPVQTPSLGPTSPITAAAAAAPLVASPCVLTPGASVTGTVTTGTPTVGATAPRTLISCTVAAGASVV